MEEKLIKNLDKYYKEFKDYENYFNSYNEEQTKVIPEKIKEFLANEASKEKAFEFMVDIRIKPSLMGLDLNILKERLLTAYETVENLELEIPQEIKTEIEELKSKKDTFIFTVKNSELHIVDQIRYDKALENTKRPEYLNMFLEEVKHIKI